MLICRLLTHSLFLLNDKLNLTSFSFSGNKSAKRLLTGLLFMELLAVLTPILVELLGKVHPLNMTSPFETYSD